MNEIYYILGTYKNRATYLYVYHMESNTYDYYGATKKLGASSIFMDYPISLLCNQVINDYKYDILTKEQVEQILFLELL